MENFPLRIVVLARTELPHVAEAWATVSALLNSTADLRVVGLDQGEGVDFQQISADIALVLGGDGALLRACRQMGYQQLPILGLNVGRLGFLADVSPLAFPSVLPQLIARNYRLVSHLMFSATLTRKSGEQQTFLGLNEVAVSAGASLAMIDVKLAIDSETVTTYSGDGVLVSTPVGSTGHNLSAGGPLLRQDLQAFVVTPICPHTISVRPIVESADRVYTLQTEVIPEGVSLVIDGQIRLPLCSGDSIEIRRAAVECRLIKFPGMSFYDVLRRKLGWGGQPNYQLRGRSGTTYDE